VTRARKGVRAGRSVTRLGRPLLAAGLLAALGWAAFQGVNRSSDRSESGRRADRLQIVRATASSAGPWIQAGVAEVQGVASRAAADPRAAVDSYASGPHAFREAFVVDRTLRRIAGAQRYWGSDNSLAACAGGDTRGLQSLVEAAATTGPVVRAFYDPCGAAVVGAAQSSANGAVAIVLASPSTLAARLDTLAHLPNSYAAFLAPDGSSVTADGAVARRPDGAQRDDISVYVPSHAQREGTATVGAVVRAWVPLPAGWAVAVDEATPEFLGSRPTQPSNWIPAAVAVCFGFAIVVVGIFDARRRKALARAEEVRSSFLAVVSHELRTPLTVLKGFVDTLLARWDHFDDTQREQLVERLAPQVRRLHRGVDRLLIAADLQRGANLRLENEKIALGELVSDVVDGFRPLAPLHAFTVDVPGDLTVVADRKALAQALDQVVDNAVKYSPAGGSVNVRARRVSRRVELVVEDESVGLPSDFSRIFEPLTQGEEVDKRVHDEGGVGVGLYITRSLFEAMGGAVRAERRAPESGTRMVVTLVAGPSRPVEGGQLAPSGRVHGPL
jgi:signal transduction histidine kinase